MDGRAAPLSSHAYLRETKADGAIKGYRHTSSPTRFISLVRGRSRSSVHSLLDKELPGYVQNEGLLPSSGCRGLTSSWGGHGSVDVPINSYQELPIVTAVKKGGARNAID